MPLTTDEKYLYLLEHLHLFRERHQWNEFADYVQSAISSMNVDEIIKAYTFVKAAVPMVNCFPPIFTVLYTSTKLTYKTGTEFNGFSV
jgi:hypothetical protein